MIKYAEHVRRREEFTRKRLRAAWRRLPRRLPRDPEEERVLLKLSLLRRQRWLAEGKLQILGPRHYRLNL